MDDVMFNWNIGIKWIVLGETDPRYVLSEVVQLLILFTMWVSLGKKMLNKRIS